MDCVDRHSDVYYLSLSWNQHSYVSADNSKWKGNFWKFEIARFSEFFFASLMLQLAQCIDLSGAKRIGEQRTQRVQWQGQMQGRQQKQRRPQKAKRPKQINKLYINKKTFLNYCTFFYQKRLHWQRFLESEQDWINDGLPIKKQNNNRLSRRFYNLLTTLISHCTVCFLYM